MSAKVWVIALAVTLGAWAQDGKILHSVRFRTRPELGVEVVVGAERYPVSQTVPLDFSNRDPLEVSFERAGFLSLPLNITSQEAVRGVFPAEDMEPIKLTATSPVWGMRLWIQENPVSAGLVALLLLVGVPGGLRRLGLYLRQQREVRERLRYLDAHRDRSDSMVMSRVERYLLVNLLGRGGMAAVYRGVPADTMDEKEAVAVKVLSRQLFAEPDFCRRFQREVQAYQKLDHPNIVRVISWRELDPSGEAPYIILEFVAGTTLGQAIPAGGMSWERARPLLEQVFAAVAFAHSRGVVHRDLKPDNIMLDQGRIKVMDFGLARGQDASQLTATGTVLGTPAFMAPEQLSQGSSDPKVDQYALGAVSYKLLSGRLPHEAEDIMQLFSKVLAEPPVPLATYRPDLPNFVHSAVMKMLARDPNLRFGSVQEAWMSLSG